MSHSKKSETDSRNNILLLTCEVKIWNEPYSKLGRILLDGGSTRTFIDQKIVKYLKLPVVGEETLSVYAFGSIKPIKKKYRVIRVELRNSKDPSRSIQIEALETDNICYTPISIPDENVLNLMNAENLSVGLQSTGDGQDHIELLIGSDFYWKIVTGTIQRLNENLVAVETMFGWCVQGQSSLSSCKFENAMTMNVAALSDQEISAQLRLFWDLEALGIKEVDDKLESKELMGKFEKEIKFKDNRYEVSLPWKSDGEEPQDNYETAKRRFKSLTKRLNNNNWLCNNYKNIILEQLKEGIIEECPNNELDMKRTYYMPHQPVINNHKTTTKVRIVYDASSKENGCKSLNDCLLPGPNLNPNLLTIILKFREKEIAFCSDIEKAFLQISVAMEDKNFLRFFWIDENQSLDGNMKIMRFKRIPFGVCSSPYLLAATIKYHIRKYESEFQRVYNMLNNYLYVDDLFYGSDEVEEAYHLSTNAVKILGDAGMNLRKWKTNSNELRHIWSQSKIIKQEETPEESLKVLGINWNNDIDCLKLDITSLIESLEHNKNTKRFVLQTVAKIFDPVGFISPFVIRAKCLLQEMWEKGLQWDEELPADAVENWTRWCSEIKHLNDFMINRKYFQENVPINADSIQLHIFCDASPRAYGAVAYFRYQEGRKFKTSFVMSKTRVSPLKQLSLPRLELMSTVIGARIADYLKDVFQLLNSNFYLWTDSSIALHWIKGTTREWKSFVSNRVTEIKSYTDPQNWYHCRGKDNPADMLTRGETVLKLINSDMWWKGAPWLLLPDTLWPQNKLNPVDPETLKTEKRAKAETSMQVKCSVAIITEPLLDAERYSKLSRIYRVTAWIKRFIHNSRKHAERKIGPLTATEISEAEIYWVKCIQSQYFGEELKQLLHGHQIGKESKLIEFNPELDANGLICVKGRLQFSNCEPREKHPWLIPSGIKYTELLISDAHNKLLHAGVADTLVEVRCKFWIVRGRQFVKSVLNKCLICKRYKVRPGVQVTAPLPADRVQESPPFSVTGIDFAGPLFTRENDGKHYILLCTCAVTRAIHLELVSNLSTETFLLALRRFVARRGLCSTIYSDNAKTYKRANLDLKEIWNNINHAKVSEFFGNAGIHWKFIVEHGAWWGGFWERMVRTVKTSLKKIIGKSSLSTDELGTILIEIESVINSRPITYVYSDPKEPSPLTPSHFLVGQRLTSLPPVTLHDGKFNSNRDQLTRRYNYRQKLLDQFWQRWRKEYMLTLMSANCVKPTKIARDFKKDDVVLLGDDRLPRNVWNLGRVLEVFPGRDGKVRSCLIKLKSGTVRRPIQLLYPLELSE